MKLLSILIELAVVGCVVSREFLSFYTQCDFSNSK